MTEVKGNVPHARVGLQGHGHPIRAAGDDLPIMDHDIPAKVRLEELRQQFAECPTLAFVRGFRAAAEIQVRRGILDHLTHDSLLVERNARPTSLL